LNVLITTDSQLREFADRASRSEVLAVDTEFMREKVYHPRLCLVQLGTDDEQVAVDPFAITDTAPLVRLFSNPFITKVFHACAQDMEVLLQYVGMLPRPLFDTQIAASYLGDRSQIGYAALVEERCGVVLAKTESLTDWSRRPLDAAQLSYALDDVRYLPAIWRAMRDELAERGRSSWVADEFEAASDPAAYVHNPTDAWKRVKRVNALSRRQLAVARELAAWREERASAIDRPRRWVLSDELVVEVAKRMPQNAEALRRIRGAADLSPADQRSVVEAVGRGRACPEGDLPVCERYARPSADEECACDLMYALARLVAAREGLAVSMLASRDDLMAHLHDPGSSPLSSGWRHEVLGSQLDELLAGRAGLTIKEGRVELL
jgi:ribonuclease D